MLNLFSLCLVFFIISQKLNHVDSATSILPPQEKPAKFAKEKGCYVPELDKVLPFNKPYSPKDGERCIQYNCGSNGFTGIVSCGVILVEAGCIIVPGNLFLEYPDCCDSVKCNQVEPPNEEPSKQQTTTKKHQKPVSTKKSSHKAPSEAKTAAGKASILLFNNGHQ